MDYDTLKESIMNMQSKHEKGEEDIRLTIIVISDRDLLLGGTHSCFILLDSVFGNNDHTNK